METEKILTGSDYEEQKAFQLRRFHASIPLAACRELGKFNGNSSEGFQWTPGRAI
jgi:hypothetical protein